MTTISEFIRRAALAHDALTMIRREKKENVATDEGGRQMARRAIAENELHAAMENLLIQVAPELRELSAPVRALMVEARATYQAEYRITWAEHDRVECTMDDGANDIGEFSFFHNRVPIEIERARELLGF